MTTKKPTTAGAKPAPNPKPAPAAKPDELKGTTITLPPSDGSQPNAGSAVDQTLSDGAQAGTETNPANSKTSSKKKGYETLIEVRRNGKRYQPGELIDDLDKKSAEDLLTAKAIKEV